MSTVVVFEYISFSCSVRLGFYAVVVVLSIAFQHYTPMKFYFIWIVAMHVRVQFLCTLVLLEAKLLEQLEVPANI